MPERHSSLVVGVAAAVVVAALAASLAAQEAEPGRGYPSTDWPFTGGNWSSSRYSTLDEINADTLDRLGAAWVAPLPGGAASRSTPVVHDGAVYLTGGANVFAFDARTGETIWHWQPDPDAGRVVSWQGVVVAGDLVVFGTRSGEVLALGRETGELVWATRVGSPEQTRGEVVTTAPMYARGKVFVGLAKRRHRRTGPGAGPRRGDRRGGVDLLRRAAAGRVRPRDLAAGQRLVGVRRRRRLAGRHRRSRSRDGLLLDRQPRADVRRRAARGGQPVHRLRPRARHGDRRAALALPGGAPRRLGRRHRHAAAAVRHDGRRRGGEGGGRDARRRLPVPVQPRDRRASAARRGARGAAGPAPAHGADPAVSRCRPRASFSSVRTGATGCRRRSS